MPQENKRLKSNQVNYFAYFLQDYNSNRLQVGIKLTSLPVTPTLILFSRLKSYIKLVSSIYPPDSWDNVWQLLPRPTFGSSTMSACFFYLNSGICRCETETSSFFHTTKGPDRKLALSVFP